MGVSFLLHRPHFFFNRPLDSHNSAMRPLFAHLDDREREDLERMIDMYDAQLGDV